MSTRDEELRRLAKRWRFAQHVIDESGRVVENPELGDVARELMWEFEQLLERGPGAPPDVAGQFRNELRRALCADLLYRGAFPLADAPVGLRLPRVGRDRLSVELALKRCKGQRNNSDRAAARILNTSVRQVQEARGERINPDDTWELATVTGHARALTVSQLLDLWRSVGPSRE